MKKKLSDDIKSWNKILEEEFRNISLITSIEE